MKPTVLYHDEYLFAMNKPEGLMVHRSSMSRGVGEFALQMARSMAGQFVYPVHRLDRPTSGVLVFALSPEVAGSLGQQFTERRVQKTYHAIVRGHLEAQGVIDYPLARDETTEKKEAITRWESIAQAEIHQAVGRYESARYSLISLKPETGRRRQLRRHCAHIRHPIIGDTSHGDGRHNRFFRDELGISGLLLLARRLRFNHPHSGAVLTLEAPWPERFNQAAEILGWSPIETGDPRRPERLEPP